MNVMMVEVHLNVLKELFKLPPEVELTHVAQSIEQQLNGTFSLLVQSPILCEVSEGAAVPWGTIKAEVGFCDNHEGYHVVRGKVENY